MAAKYARDPRDVAATWPLGLCLACAAHAMETDPWANAERASPGYVAQEIEKLRHQMNRGDAETQRKT